MPAVPGDPAALARLREVLVAEGYTDERLATALGGAAGLGQPAFDAVAVERRLPAGALRDLATLFMVGGSVRRRRAERLFGKRGCAALEQAGVLAGAGGGLRATIAVHTWEGLLLACDRIDDGAGAQHVVGMTPAAATLAHLTVRPPRASVLDLGTGCGIEALLAAAQGARHVVATDVNARAVAFAAANARLNDASGLELLTGNWFEPVAGRAFDLVVCNPPFVVSPDSALVYRDADDPGDGVSRAVVVAAAAHLAPGGYATVLGNWIRRRDEEPEPPLGWVAETGCDAIVLRYGLDDPVSYATSWNHALRASDPAGFEAAVDRWLAHYRSLGVQAIASGAVVLHRPAARGAAGPRTTTLRALEAPTGPAEAQLRRMFASQELAAGSDEDLLAATLVVPEGQALEQTLTWSGGTYVAGGGLAVLEPGAGLAVQIAPDLVEVLGRCDGTRSLRDALAGGAPEAAADAVAGVRRMLEHGLLGIG